MTLILQPYISFLRDCEQEHTIFDSVFDQIVHTRLVLVTITEGFFVTKCSLMLHKQSIVN